MASGDASPAVVHIRPNHVECKLDRLAEHVGGVVKDATRWDEVVPLVDALGVHVTVVIGDSAVLTAHPSGRSTPPTTPS